MGCLVDVAAVDHVNGAVPRKDRPNAWVIVDLVKSMIVIGYITD